jgi:activator of 2-hydroxyglutaryl-CoA dehydratase
MTVAGIDMGSQSTKVVILTDNRVFPAVTLQTGESGESDRAKKKAHQHQHEPITG